MIKKRTDLQRLVYQKLSVDMRAHEETTDFAYAMVASMQELNSLPPYSNNRTYNKGDWVSFKFRTYECQKDNTSGKQPVIDNQLNTDGSGNLLWKEVDHRTITQVAEEAQFRQTFTAQKIYMEHYLNATLNNNSISAWSASAYIASGKDIFIEDTADRERLWVFRKQKWPVLPRDALYIHQKWDSTVDYDGGTDGDFVEYQGGIYKANSSGTNYTGKSPSSDPSLWDFIKDSPYVFPLSYYYVSTHFIVWVPVEVKNSLPPGTWQEIVASRVEDLKMATRSYQIKTY